MASAGASKAAQKKPVKKLPATAPPTILNSEIIETYIIIPPDGGWGWLVTVTSFISNFTADGTIYTFGLFADDISASVGSTNTEVLFANSLMTGFYYLSGPIISALTNLFGYRAVAMVGGLIASMAILVTSYTSTLSTLLLVFGVIGGIGFGMMYVPSIVVIGFYFEKWRAIATSIAVCGSSMAIITFPIVFEEILTDMDWRGKFRILSGLCLISVLFAILYRPLEPVRVVTGIDGTVSVVQSMSASSLRTIPQRASSMSIFINATTPTATIPPLGTIREEEYATKKCNRCFTACKKCLCCCYCRRSNRPPVRPLYRDDVFYSGSLLKLPEYIASTHSSATRLFPSKPSMEYQLAITRSLRNEENKKKRCCPFSLTSTLTNMLDLSLLKSPTFMLLAISGGFSTLGLYTPFVIIYDSAKENGIGEIGAYLLSTLGISNTIGRISCGVFSSLPNLNALMCSHVSLTICGLATLALPFSYTKVWQFTCASIFGFSVACIAALRSVIIAEMLGIDKLTNGFGLCLLFQGLTCLIGVPISGYLRDVTGTYDMSYYFAGSAILFSAILLMILQAILKWEKKKQTNNE